MISSKSSGWFQDINNISGTVPDEIRASRTVDNNQSLTWRIINPTTFSARIWNAAGTPEITFGVSPDGANWTTVPAQVAGTGSGGVWTWTYTDWSPVGALPPGTNYVRVTFGPGSGYLWSPQLGYMSIMP